MTKTYTPNTPLRQVKNGMHAVNALAVVLLGGGLFAAIPTEVRAQNYDPDTAAARCRQFTNSVRNLRELADRQEVLDAVKTCIDLGVDPPLKARNAYGRAPASGIATSQIPGHTCPPFATCLFSARVNTAAASPLALSSASGSTGGGIDNTPISSVYNAPQFTGHLPNEIPAHLENGSTIYFYGSDVLVTPPANSLLYPDAGTNYYADGGRETITNGHIMVPAATDGNIMAQQPVIVNQNARFNFDDGGIIILPAGFVGVINGVEVRGGDIVIINHSDDVMIPAGTALYPFPMGSHPAGEHAGDHNHAPYTGPPIILPNAVTTATRADDPGTAIWWTQQ